MLGENSKVVCDETSPTGMDGYRIITWLSREIKSKKKGVFTHETMLGYEAMTLRVEDALLYSGYYKPWKFIDHHLGSQDVWDEDFEDFMESWKDEIVSYAKLVDYRIREGLPIGGCVDSIKKWGETRKSLKKSECGCAYRFCDNYRFRVVVFVCTTNVLDELKAKEMKRKLLEKERQLLEKKREQLEALKKQELVEIKFQALDKIFLDALDEGVLLNDLFQEI